MHNDSIYLLEPVFHFLDRMIHDYGDILYMLLVYDSRSAHRLDHERRHASQIGIAAERSERSGFRNMVEDRPAMNSAKAEFVLVHINRVHRENQLTIPSVRFQRRQCHTPKTSLAMNENAFMVPKTAELVRLYFVLLSFGVVYGSHLPR